MVDPDEDTKIMLHAAIRNHRDRHLVLGEDDCQSWFFELAHDVYAEIVKLSS